MTDSRLPLSQRQKLGNYGGFDEYEADVFSPRSLDELRAILADSAAQGRRVTFRAAGNSFHDQAQGRDRVVLLGSLGLDSIHADKERFTAGSGATWGSIVDATIARSAFPANVVTTSDTTLGGTLSANCLSRWTPVYGKEASWVERFSLLTPDGASREITKPGPGTSPENDMIFRSALGGFGWLGLITEATCRTIALPDGPPARLESEVFAIRSLDELVSTLIRYFHEGREALAQGKPAWCSSAIYPKPNHGTLSRSRFVPGETPLRQRMVHMPYDPRHTAAQLLTTIPSFDSLYWVPSWWAERFNKRPYVDDIRGFTFMMDGNKYARLIAARAGIRVRVIQQSYMLPIDGHAPSRAIVRFIEGALEQIRREGLEVTLFDMVCAPAEETLLSANRGMNGCAVTLTFQKLAGDRPARVQKLMRALSRDCANMGGRVHLVKHVHAEPEVLREMYGPAFDEFRTLADRLDPRGVLRNDFFDRLFAD